MFQKLGREPPAVVIVGVRQVSQIVEGGEGT